MRLYGYLISIALIAACFVIYIPVIHRYSPQIYVIEQDIITMTQKYDKSNKHQHRIPRIIHQTWKNSIIPQRWNLSVESVRKYNADTFEYRLWTDKDMHTFVREKEPDLYINTFLTYSYDIQRVDAFRYVLLYHLGGVYIDMDIGCSKPLNSLLNVLEELDSKSIHLAALPATKPSGVSNDFMISTKGHPFFGQLMSRLSLFNHNYIIYYLTVMLSAGPLFVSLNERSFDTSSQESPVRILHEEIYGRSYLWFAGGNSWHGRDGLLITSIYNFVRDQKTVTLIVVPLALILVTIWVYLFFRRRCNLKRLKRLSVSVAAII
jgi:mannosyltransferase OCH1-like enzyme